MYYSNLYGKGVFSTSVCELFQLSLPNNVWRLIVFAPFHIIIKSLKQRLETYCFCSISYYYYYYGSQAKFGRHIVFAPFLITSPRTPSGDVLLFYVSFSLLLLFLYPPQTKFGGVYRNHLVRPFVHLSMYLVSATPPKRLIGFL